MKNDKSVILTMLVIALFGCSKPKFGTLSGVFVYSYSNSSMKSETTYDFRTDGNVIYRAYSHGEAKASGSVEINEEGEINEDGKGTYSIEDSTVTVKISYKIRTSGPHQKNIPEDRVSVRVFKIEGEDLLEVSKDEKILSDQKRLMRKKG